MKLYNYFRSSASYRVRIVANLKSLSYENISINLARGESRAPAYEALNPQGRVPALEDNGNVIGQSLAICEYLEETHPQPPILPSDPAGRARVRAIALAVACEIHPIQGGRAQAYLGRVFHATEEQRAEWSRYWMTEGFRSIEAMLAGSPATGRFCHGDKPTLADIFIVPQVYNAERSGVEMAAFPTIRRICAECSKVEAFEKARPEHQPDAA
ncbi:MAG TPA: maleylacetoacetate isomerase [Candidatus Binataceae bacterium]|nr:maleylacetoacetate isomerase [Candidatus Binataceae bacterium]